MAQIPCWKLMFEETPAQQEQYLKKEVWLKPAEKCISPKHKGSQRGGHLDTHQDKENLPNQNLTAFESFAGYSTKEVFVGLGNSTHREISNLTYSNFSRPESRELARKRSDRSFREQRILIARSIEDAFNRSWGVSDV